MAAHRPTVPRTDPPRTDRMTGRQPRRIGHGKGGIFTRRFPDRPGLRRRPAASPGRSGGRPDRRRVRRRVRGRRAGAPGRAACGARRVRRGVRGDVQADARGARRPRRARNPVRDGRPARCRAGVVEWRGDTPGVRDARLPRRRPAPSLGGARSGLGRARGIRKRARRSYGIRTIGRRWPGHGTGRRTGPRAGRWTGTGTRTGGWPRRRPRTGSHGRPVRRGCPRHLCLSCLRPPRAASAGRAVRADPVPEVRHGDDARGERRPVTGSGPAGEPAHEDEMVHNGKEKRPCQEETEPGRSAGDR